VAGAALDVADVAGAVLEVADVAGADTPRVFINISLIEVLTVKDIWQVFQHCHV
jgi:hypothetical protein